MRLRDLDKFLTSNEQDCHLADHIDIAIMIRQALSNPLRFYSLNIIVTSKQLKSILRRSQGNKEPGQNGVLSVHLKQLPSHSTLQLMPTTALFPRWTETSNSGNNQVYRYNSTKADTDKDGILAGAQLSAYSTVTPVHPSHSEHAKVLLELRTPQNCEKNVFLKSTSSH